MQTGDKMPPKKDAKPEEQAAATAGSACFYVKHGEARQTLFNSDCWASTLLDTIREVAGCDPDTACDLQDGETGAVLGLAKLDVRASARPLITPARAYVLVVPQYATEGPEEGLVVGVEALYTPPEGESLPPPPPPAGGKPTK